MSYLKKTVGDNVYYFSESGYGMFLLDNIPSDALKMMRFADYVADFRTNKLVKCRGCVESILDAAFITPKEKKSTEINSLFIESLKMAIDSQELFIRQSQAELYEEKNITSDNIKYIVAGQIEKQKMALALLKDYVKRNEKQ